MVDPIIQVVTTTADKQDAETLAQALLAKRLAACVQISGPIDSSYWWNGRIETGTEWTCKVKTVRSLYQEVEQTLLDLHPYDQPEILAIEVSDVSAGYANWMREQLQPEFPPETAPPSTPAPQKSAPPPTAPATKSLDAPAAPPNVAAPAADVTPAQAAELIPAAGLAAAAQSNVPQSMPFAAGNVEAPGAIHQPLHAAPESSVEASPAAAEAAKPAAKRGGRKKTPKPSA